MREIKNIKLYIKGGRRCAPLKGLEMEPELFKFDSHHRWWFVRRFGSVAEARAEARAIAGRLKLRGGGVFFKFEKGCVGLKEHATKKQKQEKQEKP